MAKPLKPSEVTVKAVLKYAATLRERAQRARIHDPFAEPYEITDAAARKVSQQLGPAAALTELARRAKAHELREAEKGARAAYARSEHLAHQLVFKGEREASASVLSLEQRLAIVRREASLLSETSAARLDADRVRGGERASVLMSRRRERFEDTVASLEDEVERLVGRWERLVESTRRRLVEEEVAA